MTTMILSMALIGEGVALVGLLAVVLQLRARLARVTGASTAAVAQMSDLVREAQTLSANLTGQIAEQASLCEALAERVEEATALSQRAAPVVETPEKAPARAARSAAKTVSAGEETAPARTRRKAAASEEPTVEEKAPARSRSRKALATDAAPAYDPQADIAAAREKGMDPIAIAVQRNLANKQHAFTA
jgi:hypothetical protein